MVNQRDSEFPGHPASKGVVSPIYDGRTGHCLNNSSFDPYASDGSNSPSLLVNCRPSADPESTAGSSPLFSAQVKFEEDVVIIDGIPVSGNNREYGGRSSLTPISNAGGASSSRGLGRANPPVTPISNAGGDSSGRGFGRGNSPMTPISNAGSASSGRGFGRGHSLMTPISNPDGASSGRGFGRADSPLTPISNVDGASSDRGFGRGTPMTPISNAGGASSGSGSGGANSSMTPISNAGSASSGSSSGHASSSMTPISNAGSASSGSVSGGANSSTTPSNAGGASSGRGSGSNRPNVPIVRSGWSISTSILPVTQMSNLTNSSEGSSSLAPSNTAAEVESALERSSPSFVREFPPLTPSRAAALPTTTTTTTLPPLPPRALRFNQLFGVPTPRRQIPDTAKEVKQLSAATVNPSCTVTDTVNEVKLITDTAKEANQPSTGTTPFPLTNAPPEYRPWSPEDDGILAWADVPREMQPSRQQVDDYIDRRFYGAGRHGRLPYFRNICPDDSGSQ